MEMANEEQLEIGGISLSGGLMKEIDKSIVKWPMGMKTEEAVLLSTAGHRERAQARLTGG